MSKRTKLTNSSDETQIASLISGDSIFTIPYFQRPYKWKKDKLTQLNRDILNIIDSGDTHFLGAIIIHGRRSNPADPTPFDIIDGQQRITTLVLYLCAIIKTLCIEKEYETAASLFLKYLVIGRETRLPSNMKLHPCKEDRAQLNYVYNNLLSDSSFKAKLGGIKINLLKPTGNDRGVLRNNYHTSLRFMKEQLENEGIKRIHDIYAAILEFISVVQIDVWDPTNGPKIFDGLNSRQEPMTIGDLVRNEIFSRVSNEKMDLIDQIDEQNWQPFYKRFQQDSKNLFDSYFFPFGLIKNPNLKKSEVYNYLRESWQDISEPEEIIISLSEYQKAFIDIVLGMNYQKHAQDIEGLFKNLKMLGLPSSTYPFLMKLSNAIKENKVCNEDGKEILKTIESFLVRRAICGHEPTGLHAVFKRLWIDCNNNPNNERVVNAIQKHKTVIWPGDEELINAIKRRSLYGSAITNYVLRQYDISLKGDCPTNIPWIEHVLPDKPAAEWFKDFDRDEHEILKDTLANLIPLTEEMNRMVSNKPYSVKKEKYEIDSSFKSAREFAKKFKTWTPKDMEVRSDELATWAIIRWPDNPKRL